MNHVGGAAQSLEFFLKEHAVGVGKQERHERIDRLREVEVAVHDDVSGVVGEEHRYSAVFLDNAQQEVDMPGSDFGRLVGGGADCRQLAGGICPNLHAGALLGRKIFYELRGIVEKKRHHHYRDHEENDSAVAPYFVDIKIHVFITGFPA